MLRRNGPVVKREVRGVSPEAGRESMEGKICVAAHQCHECDSDVIFT